MEILYKPNNFCQWLWADHTAFQKKGVNISPYRFLTWPAKVLPLPFNERRVSSSLHKYFFNLRQQLTRGLDSQAELINKRYCWQTESAYRLKSGLRSAFPIIIRPCFSFVSTQKITHNPMIEIVSTFNLFTVVETESTDQWTIFFVNWQHWLTMLKMLTHLLFLCSLGNIVFLCVSSSEFMDDFDLRWRK